MEKASFPICPPIGILGEFWGDRYRNTWGVWATPLSEYLGSWYRNTWGVLSEYLGSFGGQFASRRAFLPPAPGLLMMLINQRFLGFKDY